MPNPQDIEAFRNIGKLLPALIADGLSELSEKCEAAPSALLSELAKLSDRSAAEELNRLLSALELADYFTARAALMKLCADGNVQALKLFFENRRKSSAPPPAQSADVEDIFSARSELSGEAEGFAAQAADGAEAVDEI